MGVISIDDDHVESATLSDGASESSDAVIATDGIHSPDARSCLLREAGRGLLGVMAGADPNSDRLDLPANPSMFR
jgi:2-polyprenyl-6-methoxyphenol hydroxylase-like FAD-dependent oxidoreductase